MKKEHIKSFILILLIINSIQLTVQLWFDGSSFGLDDISLPFFGNDDAVSEETMFLNATRPRSIIINGGGAREVYGLGSKEYETAYSYVEKVIEEFKKSNVPVRKISYEDWENLFKGKSIYADFGYSFDYDSLNVLYDAVNSPGKFEQFASASGFIITPDTVTSSCSVCLYDSLDKSVYEYAFKYDSADLLGYIEHSTQGKQQNDTFAFEINLDTASEDSGEIERMVELSPMVLLSVFADTDTEETVIASNIFETSEELERFAEKTLPAFGYSSSLLRKTVQNDGTVVYVENNATIKYYANGKVEYNAVSKDSGMKKSSGATDSVQALNDVLKIVKELWIKADTDNQTVNLHLSSELADNKDDKYIIRLSNMHNGAMIRYDNQNSDAVYAVVEDGYITAFTMHFADFSMSDSKKPLMPVLYAIDSLYEKQNSKIIIDDVFKCYDLNSFGEVYMKWAFKVRGSDELLVVDNWLGE